MDQLVTDSNITLIQLEETEPHFKRARHEDDLNHNHKTKIEENGPNSQKSTKRSKFRLRWRKKREVSDSPTVNMQSNSSKPDGWTTSEGGAPVSNGIPVYNVNGTSTEAGKRKKTASNQEKAADSDDDSQKKQSIFSWIKSLFSRKDKELDFSRSNTTKLLYFGFLMPAFVFHPDSLLQCNTAKFDDVFKLDLAAAHIDDALHSRGRYGKARATLKPKNIQKCFQIISSRYWEYLLYLFIALHCFMAFWEQSPTPTPVGENWYGNWTMHVSVLVIDATCNIIYVADIALLMAFLSWRHFWNAKEHFWIRVEFVFTVMFIIDFIILVLEKALEKRLIAPFRCLRAAMLLCKSKNVSHIFKVLISIMSRLGKVFAIIFIFIFTFASIGLHLYMEDYHEIVETCTNTTTIWNCTNVYSGAFDQVAIASLHMFVLMSTENYPDVIIPAYEKSAANFFYFMFYLYAGVFFLTAILLAIIVESYWEYSKKHVKMERLRQREELIKAWNLLDLSGVGRLSVDDPKLLKLFRKLRPENTDDENQDLLMYMSENNEECTIDSYDWTTRLVETLSIEFERETQDQDPSNSSNQDPGCWKKFRKITAKAIHAPGIGVTILVLILIHSILFALMWSGISDTVQLAFQICRSVIIFLFVIEVTMRIISDGSKLLNILDLLDFSMVLVAIGGNVAWYILWYTNDRTTIQIYLGACIVASSLAVLARLLFNSEQARSAVHIVSNIYPVMFDLILLVITIIYFYAILGLEIFQDNTLAKSNERGYFGSYVQYDCGVGFETFGCALMIVFQIVTTNDWHQIMLGAMIDAGWASSFYFISCYLIINMIVMNLFVAISIEAYKKLARDTREIEAQSELQQEDAMNDGDSVQEQNQSEPTSPTYGKGKFDRGLGEVANAVSGIFASSRVRNSRDRRPSNSPAIGLPATPGIGRRGPRGSIAALSIHTVSSDDNSDEDTVLSRRSVPGSPRLRTRSFRFSGESPRVHRISTTDTPILRKTGSIKESGGKTPARDRRQRMIKARSDRVRQERKAKQQLQEEQLQQQQQSPPSSSQSNRLEIPSPKLSISDVVKLKKMVKVKWSYRARSSKEMSVDQGQTFSVTGESGNMYRGPDGWFPKDSAVDLDMDVNDGSSFTSSTDSPSMRKRKVGKVVNFKVEDETAGSENHSKPGTPTRLQPSPQLMQHRLSQSRMVMRQGGNDWRRSILGDMTVMNKNEMEELKKLLRGGNFEKRQPRNLGDTSRPTSFSARRVQEEVIRETIEEREEEAGSPEVPEVRVSEAPIPSEASSESNDDTVTKRSSTGTLSVPGPVPKKTKKTAQKQGEMPEWAKKFAASTGVELQEDLKFDETKLKSAGSSDEEDRFSNLAGVTVHRSDTSTGSSFENFTETSESTKELPKSSNSTKNDDPDKLTSKLVTGVSPATRRKKKSVSFKANVDDPELVGDKTPAHSVT